MAQILSLSSIHLSMVCTDRSNSSASLFFALVVISFMALLVMIIIFKVYYLFSAKGSMNKNIIAIKRHNKKPIIKMYLVFISYLNIFLPVLLPNQ